MKPINNGSSKEERSAPRAKSPSFRAGHRQRPSDASTDEIVRFVREFQRCKPPPPTHTISAMKTRAVLPSIERKRSDVKNACHQRISMSVDEEVIGHSFESTNDMDIDSRYGTQGMAESTRDGLDTNVEYENDKSEQSYGNSGNDYLNYRSDSIRKPRHKAKDFRNEMSQKRHSNYEISLDIDRLLPKSNGVSSGSNAYSRHKRSSLNTQTSLYSNNNDLTSSHIMDQSFLQNTLSRPTALRQLPPIINKDTQSSEIQRPSAPSPNKASPGLESCSSDDDSSAEDDHNGVDEDGDEGIDDVNKSNVILDDDRDCNKAKNERSKDDIQDDTDDDSVDDGDSGQDPTEYSD